MTFWQKETECIDRNILKEKQLENLKQLVKKLYDTVPFYRQKIKESGISPEDIHSLSDIKHLPFTDKKDLRDNYPFGLFAVPKEDIIRLHASSGTTGKPTVAAYTKKDLENWADLMARNLCCAGADKNSIVQVAYGYGLFTGGLGMHYGVERLGAYVIPASGGNTARQVQLMKDFKVTTICCTPSYALNLADYIRENGFSLEDFSVKTGIFGAEPWTDNMRAEIENQLNIKAHDIYGLTEIMGPGVAMECAFQQGLHIWEDAFYPEIIDADGNVLPDGEVGELVITTLQKEAMPLLRYRTHDITRLIAEPCPCGRTHRKIEKVKMRTDDMLVIRGVNVFPSQAETLLMNIEGIRPQFRMVVDRVKNLDTLLIEVELDNKLIGDTVKDLENLRNKVAKTLSEGLLVRCAVKLLPTGSLVQGENKFKRIVDLRK
ncbi:MAG: phenylacetate--CoA ligase, partial [Eubacteriales bacterium]|nr:phenylacetate--CoA ligase [Eubacteriales bacterium]